MIPLADITDYPSMLAAFRARADQCRISRGADATSDVAGLPDNYLNKLLAPRPPRRIGMVSLGPVLGVLGVKLVMVEDAAAMARFGSQLPARNDKYVHAAATTFTLTSRFMQKIGRKGAIARNKTMNARRRRALAKKAATTRWGRKSK